MLVPHGEAGSKGHAHSTVISLHNKISDGHDRLIHDLESAFYSWEHYVQPGNVENKFVHIRRFGSPMIKELV